MQRDDAHEDIHILPVLLVAVLNLYNVFHLPVPLIRILHTCILFIHLSICV